MDRARLPHRCSFCAVNFSEPGRRRRSLHLARAYMQNGLRAALIVNDQAGGLVDQASALATGSPAVGEVAGGCFCCKLSALTETLPNQLGKDHQPDVFFAEPVGSCTDIVATVGVAVAGKSGERVRVAPFSVLADCRRVIRELLCPRRQQRLAGSGIIEERFLHLCIAA